MPTADQLATMKDKLARAGIPHHDIKAFGAIRCNVHVRCIGHDTAQRWAHLLGKVFAGAPVRMVETMWEAAANHGTCLKPTMRRGWIVAVAA